MTEIEDVDPLYAVPVAERLHYDVNDPAPEVDLSDVDLDEEGEFVVLDEIEDDDDSLLDAVAEGVTF